MAPFQSILSGLAGVSLAFLGFNIYLVLRSRQKLYLAFMLACLGMVIYIPCNIILYQTGSVEIYVRIVQVQMYGTALFFIGVVALYTFYLQFPSRVPLILYCAGFAFFLAARQINPMLMYSEFSGMSKYVTLWGEQLWLPVAKSSTGGISYTLMIFSIFFVVIGIGISQYRRGYRVQSTFALFALALLLLMTIHDAIVYSFNLRWLFLGETGFVLLISVLELVVADDVLRANILAEQIKQLNAELEKRVQERTAQLEAANQELEAFSYSISHDLRAPLRAINGFTKILNEDFSTELSPMAQGFLRKIGAAGDRMGRLIDNLLDFSRLGRKPLATQPVDINSIVHMVIETLTPEIAVRQVEWVLHKLPGCVADPLLIQQVYANLIGNAVKYSRNQDVARIEVGSAEQDGQTVYFVRDNGAGFDMHYAQKLFGVFQRLHRDDEFEGTGIGLATVKRIIERHGGRIWAEAQVDQGAAFYFTL